MLNVAELDLGHIIGRESHIYESRARLSRTFRRIGPNMLRSGPIHVAVTR